MWVAAGALVDFLGNNLCFCSDPSCATVSFGCICLIRNDGNLLDFRVCDHLFHEGNCIVPFLQIPFVQNYVYA